MSCKLSPQKARTYLIKDLTDLGFDRVGVLRADHDKALYTRLQDFIASSHHGTMTWMEETLDRRSHPKKLWHEAASIVMVAMGYGPDETYDPLEALKKGHCATISCYAHNRDYHDIMKGKLKQAAGRFVAKTGAQVKVFVDTAPVMEKPLAQMAGLGWQGKHTNLVSRDLGSWFFLGAIFTDMTFEPEMAEEDHCGSCRSCLDICPTNAFPAPYQLDARRCISYLTIEHKGPIAHQYRKAIGNRIYGCDDCLAICPWNKFAQSAQEAKLRAREDLKSPPLRDLLVLSDADFRTFFSGSPVKRIGRDRFIRNCLIAAGNSNESELIGLVRNLLSDNSALVRGAAIWALSRLLENDELHSLYEKSYDKEGHSDVRDEWQRAAS